MEILKTEFKDLYVIKTKTYKDDRGEFLETFNNRIFKIETGLSVDFVQDNQSKSKLGVLRGLHYQEGVYSQAKLVRVIDGVVLDVVVDMRRDSKTFGKHFKIVLSSEDNNQLFVPRGFAHGFIALSDTVTFAYKCDNHYNPNFDKSIYALDPTLNIDWRVDPNKLIMSEKDKNAQSWKEAIKKKVLLIGATGQLGRCIVDEMFNFENKIELTSVSSKELDITNTIKVHEYFSKQHFDYVINAAAYTDVDGSETNSKNMDVNAWGPFHLANVCNEYDITLIHISTDYVFDGIKDEPYEVDDKTNPLNEYGKAKNKAEFAISDMMEKHYIIRTSWLFSEYGNNFAKTILSLGMEYDKIEVVGDQIGRPTYAGDLALFIIIALIDKDPKAYGTYHFTNEEIMSWYDFANIIIAHSRIITDIRRNDDFESKVERPKNSVLDTSLTERVFKVHMPSVINGIDIVIDNFDEE